MMEPHYLGNMDLLTFRKVGFLASRKVNPTSVIPTINWANKVSHNPNAAIISGFQSTLECEVLDIILKGTCGIIYVLNRSLYRQIPLNLRSAFDSNRILFISLTSEKTTRPSKTNANIRNQYITDIADSLVFASVNESSSLYQLAHINKTTLKL
jgi:predicted Rossmann fold nucleotide-binding protein DprA/Smf involved in DNA uptake